MKSTIYILLLAGFLMSSMYSFSQTSKLINVTIEFTDFGTQTLVAVDCSQFKKIFKPTIIKHKIIAYKELIAIESDTKHFLLTDGEEKIDVRGIITFTYKNTAIKYCFDRHGLFYGKDRYFKKAGLMANIQKIIDSRK